MNTRLIKIMAGAAAVVAIALGGIAIGRTGSGTSAAATPGGAQGAPPNGARGGGPGFGADVTGTTAAKVKAAVLAKYPGATLERVMQLPDGSYVAHVFPASGTEVHVAVSKDFKVTGTEQGGPPQGGTPPAGAPTAPSSSQKS